MGKICSCCKIDKPLEEFYKSSTGEHRFGVRGYCKSCSKIKQSEYHHRDGSNSKNTYYIKKYGITLSQYEDLYKKQRGKCKICKNLVELLFVDHDHKTGIIRGLLCVYCNTGLGMFRDNKNLLLSAIKYLG